MKFKYQARTKTGELQVGNIEAQNQDAALGILSSHELFVLSVEEAEEKKFGANFLNIFKRVKAADVMVFTRQFSILLSAKISLSDILKNLYKQTTSLTLKEAIFEIGNDIDSGLSLSQALERHPNIFSDFYINIVRSAEVTGRVEEVMGFLADYLEKEASIISKVRNALIYPAFIIGLFVVVAIVMVVFVMPQMRPIFTESNIKLPLITQMLFSGSDFFTAWWWLIIIVGGIFIFVLVDYIKTEEGKMVFDEVMVRLPILGKINQKFYVARFAESASVLIRGGIPITQAIEIAGHTIDNVVYRDTLHNVAESVRQGELMSTALSRSEYFPPLVAQLVSVGESTGKLDEMFTRLASFFTREVDDTVSNLMELIQPALMVMMGLFVGGLFAALLLPLYQLSQAF